LLKKNDTTLSITSIEFKILSLLMENPGRVFTKVQIFEKIWSEEFIHADDNTVMVHISRIRDKIEDNPRDPIYIKTIRGLGYKFEKQST
jgi:DNA-binding response OmpR family regulator